MKLLPFKPAAASPTTPAAQACPSPASRFARPAVTLPTAGRLFRRALLAVAGLFYRGWLWILDDSEFRCIERRPPHTLRCDLCGDVHDIGEVCPQQQVGNCDVCGTVRLDRYGNCSLAGDRWRFHAVTNRRSWADEVARKRLSRATANRSRLLHKDMGAET